MNEAVCPAATVASSGFRSYLPDCRAYEQVTPVQKNGAVVDSVFAGALPDVAGDGSRVMYLSIQCFAGAASCTGQRLGEGEPYASTRTGGGWTTAALAPPAQLGGNTTELLGADLGTALFSVATPPGGEDDWFARRPDGSLGEVGPLSSPALGPLGPHQAGAGVVATASLSRVVWTRGGMARWPFDSTTSNESVYAYSGVGNSQPTLVGVSGGPGSTDLISECGTLLGGQGANDTTQGALSADGNTVFFTAEQCTSGSGVNSSTPVPANTVYARIDGARTVLISGRSPGSCTTSGCQSSSPRSAFLVAGSEDGSKAFFLSPQQLADDASEDPVAGDHEGECTAATGVNGCNLYLYDFANPAGRELIDVSAGDTSGGGPRVQGVVAAAPDGSHVYFVARGVLASNQNGVGQTAQSGANNLYVYERDAAHSSGQMTFIATLPASDSREWSIWLANVTPDGRFLVFTNHGQLTADAANTSGAAQVYRYDAQTGKLLRLSLGSNGFNNNGNSGRGDATIVAARNFVARLGPMRTNPTMSDDGSYVFFQSPIALAPNALNDVATDSEGDLAQNVYEWHEGQVSLISDGRDRSGDGTFSCQDNFHFSSVCLLGSDRSGANVFFTTSDSLVAQDSDTELDIYDARVDGGFPYTPPASLCQGEACQGAPGAQLGSVTAATVAFSGSGNLVTPGPVVVAHRKPAVKKHVRRRGRRRRPVKRRAHGVGRTVLAKGGRR
ncbi:MAG TPA: hypothetical protein VGY76_14460 [Solirubrobacteraceae bacterium]|nr:hypothetical protein [Solirubrobacteraceae bacterium]